MAFLAHIPYGLLPWQLVALIFGSICIGMSKTGINGISTIAIPLFVLVFEAKPSTGVILPLLCFADLFAVIYYRRHAEWKYIVRLLPWALAGFAAALFADRFVPAKGFKMLIGVCILAGLVIMFWNDRRGKGAAATTGWLRTKGSTALFGILGGFSTMIGNAAGPVMSVFLLSVRLPKASFVGTAAWFFLIVNYLKIPLQYFAWHNISVESLLFDAYMAPFVLVGVALGILLVKKISESAFRVMIYALTLVSTVLLFV
ncbi:anion permease [Spirochaetia bacterium]|nr:anion permease [Spirochaetia bacterium]